MISRLLRAIDRVVFAGLPSPDEYLEWFRQQPQEVQIGQAQRWGLNVTADKASTTNKED